MKKKALAVVLNCLVEEINDFEQLAFLHMLSEVMKAKSRPIPFDNDKFDRVIQAYCYFRTMERLGDEKLRPLDTRILSGVIIALKQSDSRIAHDFISELALNVIRPKSYSALDWFAFFTKGTTKEDLFRNIDLSIDAIEKRPK